MIVSMSAGMKWNEDNGEIGEAHKIEGLFKPFDSDNKGFSFYVPLTWLVRLILKMIKGE